MVDTVYVTDHNPALFFAALADQIKAGFYADDSVAGHPHFDILNEVKLTRTDKPSQRHDHTKANEVHISAWHNTNLVLDYQDAVLQGFEVVPESIKLGDPYAPHYLVMKRVGPSVETDKEIKASGLTGFQVDAIESGVPAYKPAEADTMPVDAVEATVKARRGGRPAKPKEV